MIASSTAFATVTQPNQVDMPLDRSDPASPDYDPAYQELSLKKFFADQQKEVGLDWKKDAQTTPATFYPLCGFTAKLVLSEAGNHYGISWYNATGGLPLELVPIVLPNSPVGTTVSGASIATDPKYAGGAVGFALVGGQTHYSERQLNAVCTSCSTVAPWATAVIYKSVLYPNSFYLAFEDGNVTSSTFNNDGDFNDDVFLLSGLQCQGGGQPCSTGQPGVCAQGVTECDGSCKQSVPSSGEVCNGLDDDCNGTVDDGALCDPGSVCAHGQCVPQCNGSEFECGGTGICQNGVCVEPGCLGKTCGAGQICVAGQCVGGCDGVVCPYGQVCRGNGTCVDPCKGVTCPSLTVCQLGACVPSCACLPCASGNTCTASGTCVDDACLKIDGGCPAGTQCKAGACVDACDGVVCPAGQECKQGACTLQTPPDLGTSTGGDDASAGGGDVVDMSASSSDDAGHGGVGGGGPAGGRASGASGCGCRVGAPSSTPGAAALLLVLGGLVILARRRGRHAR